MSWNVCRLNTEACVKGYETHLTNQYQPSVPVFYHRINYRYEFGCL